MKKRNDWLSDFALVVLVVFMLSTIISFGVEILHDVSIAVENAKIDQEKTTR